MEVVAVVLLWCISNVGTGSTFGTALAVLTRSGDALEDLNVKEVFPSDDDAITSPKPLMVPITLVQAAASLGAVCLDGTLPGYHLHRGYGLGANSWLVQLEGGGWCNSIRNCVYRKTTRHGSSNYMEKQIPFTGILSNRPEENPDFFNWNRVKLRYCDGASFSGDSQNESPPLFFRGQRIWLAGMEDLMSKGMDNANQALLSGCSAGGLASILHCDEFRDLFPSTTKVKCLSDAGLFLDATDISGGHTLRNMFEGVVSLQVSLCHMACRVGKEVGGLEEVTFLYRLTPGACPKSYGVNVARLAGLPETVLHKAAAKSQEFEAMYGKQKRGSEDKEFIQNWEDVIALIQSLVEIAGNLSSHESAESIGVSSLYELQHRARMLLEQN